MHTHFVISVSVSLFSFSKKVFFCMNSQIIGKILHETFPEKKFYSNWNIEDITVKDYEHAKIVWKEFRIKNLGEYLVLYVQSNIVLYKNISGRIWNKKLWWLF